MTFAGRAGIVTGASRGIGYAVAERLAGAGAGLLLCARDGAAVERAAATLAQGGAKVVATAADVGRPADAERLVEGCLTQFGRLDILVNNAGIARDALLLRMKPEDWDAVLAVNLTGAFHCTRAALRAMVKQRAGRIINVTSVVGVMGNAGQANYVAAKAGLIGLTKAAAREVASRGITVNAVAPGFIETEMTAALPAATREGYRTQIPLGRFGSPGEVAEVVAFLASDAAAYITGQVIHVNGGLWM
ncbi:MAG: 3-oxoacyl-[acyl-carrier-protein] reductase [candidate division NC10 bacterium]|nr:3-oxoacyl-[acyl-carrier-protein] reductase [candidate division NC10 bacterium]MBI4391505.1 3-oxoacyl-[acyl-carrier-protein] reductase [candidate division NC10 bacterium]